MQADELILVITMSWATCPRPAPPDVQRKSNWVSWHRPIDAALAGDVAPERTVSVIEPSRAHATVARLKTWMRVNKVPLV